MIETQSRKNNNGHPVEPVEEHSGSHLCKSSRRSSAPRCSTPARSWWSIACPARLGRFACTPARNSCCTIARTRSCTPFHRRCCTAVRTTWSTAACRSFRKFACTEAAAGCWSWRTLRPRWGLPTTSKLKDPRKAEKVKFEKFILSFFKTHKILLLRESDQFKDDKHSK